MASKKKRGPGRPRKPGRPKGSKNKKRRSGRRKGTTLKRMHLKGVIVTVKAHK